MDERCPKNPSLRRYECSHCQGIVTGTKENPRFSLKEDNFNGYPVVEVLKNGGPIHWYDSHFRFGQRKAEMLLACLPALKEFGWAGDDERLKFEARIVEDDRGRCIRVFVRMNPDFEHSTGATIDRPWLFLQAMPPEDTHLGLGMMKCRAICAVASQLQGWLVR